MLVELFIMFAMFVSEKMRESRTRWRISRPRFRCFVTTSLICNPVATSSAVSSDTLAPLSVTEVVVLVVAAPAVSAPGSSFFTRTVEDEDDDEEASEASSVRDSLLSSTALNWPAKEAVEGEEPSPEGAEDKGRGIVESSWASGASGARSSRACPCVSCAACAKRVCKLTPAVERGAG